MTTKLAIVARLVAKPGKEEEVSAFLASALPLAQAEAGTIVWFALRFSKSEFGIFDAFPDEAGRDAHLGGPIAAALMAKAGELLSEPPRIEKVDVLAAKLLSRPRSEGIHPSAVSRRPFSTAVQLALLPSTPLALAIPSCETAASTPSAPRTGWWPPTGRGRASPS